MSNLIKILPDFIANQIAAGEVVQRPESVVKELVENSLDSGASEIGIIIKKAGKQLIHIVDNGNGLAKEDLPLSIKRHATSKVFSQEDLEEIRSFGFRGEALASIASVANLEIRTRRADDEHGWKMLCEPMKDEKLEPVNMDYGTQVFVRNLFYNVPARRKFLKSDIAEFRYISDTVLRLAVSNPNIKFTFYDNDVLIFDVQSSDLTKRIEGLFGKKVSSSILPVFLENDDIKIDGYIGEPLIAKQSKSGQFLFLNGRHIVSKALSHAIFSAFEHLLEKRSHPFYVLNIQLDPKNIDVNVHPQKHEVKFEDERFVYNHLRKAVSEALRNHNLVPETSVELNNISSPIEKINNSDDDIILVNKTTGEIINTGPQIPKRQDYSSFRNFNKSNDSFNSQNQSPSSVGKTAYDVLFGKNESDDISNEQSTSIEGTQSSSNMYWQMHKKYIFVQSEKGVMLIDQHAAHERILYERAVQSMNKEFKNTQELLFPVPVHLNSSQKLLLNELKEEISDLGFRLAMSESENVSIAGVPLDIKSGEEESAFYEILEQYEEYERTRDSDKRDNLAASYGCRTAIKSGHKLSIEEMDRLITDLFKSNMPYVCPHGRPIIIEFTLKEFDKKFGRI